MPYLSFDTGVLKNSLEIREGILNKSSIVNLKELLVELSLLLNDLPVFLLRCKVVEVLRNLTESRIVLFLKL